MPLYESGLASCDHFESRTFVHSQVVGLIALDQILRLLLRSDRTFVHSQVVGLIALDQILRLLLRSVNRVTLERNFGGMLFLDRPSNPTCFRVPLNVVSHFEVVFHRRAPSMIPPIQTR